MVRRENVSKRKILSLERVQGTVAPVTTRLTRQIRTAMSGLSASTGSWGGVGERFLLGVDAKDGVEGNGERDGERSPAPSEARPLIGFSSSVSGGGDNDEREEESERLIVTTLWNSARLRVQVVASGKV
jgi:hypothetical protein